jgi:hypothetical protein
VVFQNVTNTDAHHIAFGAHNSYGTWWVITTDANTGDTSQQLGWGGSAQAPPKGLGSYAHANGTPYVRTAVKNGSAWYSYINGAAQGTGPTDDTTSLLSNSNFTVGAEYPMTAFSTNSDIVFVALYSRALSNEERQKIERWLGSRYGITVA